MKTECKNCIYYNQDDTYPDTGFCTLWSDYRNENDNCYDWEEIDDVEIMLAQMKLYFNISDAVKRYKTYKIKRLEEKLR